MKITNQQIQTILLNIMNVELDPIKSSARRRIVRSIKDYAEDAEIVRMELISKYATKKGEMPERDVQGGFKFTRDNHKKFKKEYAKILNEVIEIKIDETNKKDWGTIKSILEDEKKKHAKEKMNANTFDLVEELQEVIDLIK